MTREQRQLMYVGVLVELTGLDGEDLSMRPPDEQFLILVKAIEERGVTLQDVEGWTAICDPEGGEPPPGYDPVQCFRDKATTAMSEPMSLGRTTLLWGGVGAIGAFIVAKFFARR